MEPEVTSGTGSSDKRTGMNRLVEGRYGTFVYNANDMYVGRSLETYGEWAELEVDVFRQVVRPGDVVVDVGANLGTHTVFFAKAVGRKGRVYALEPQRVVFQLLCANVALNGLLNVHCLHVAAMAAEQAVTVPHINYEVPNNFGHLQLGTWDSGEEVEGIPLDSLKLPACRLLKIDVEGRELDVLHGAVEILRKHRPMVFVENNVPQSSPALISFLEQEKYRLFWHLGFFFNPKNFRGVEENVFGPLFDVNLIGIPAEGAGSIENFIAVSGPEDTWEAALKRSQEAAGTS